MKTNGFSAVFRMTLGSVFASFYTRVSIVFSICCIALSCSNHNADKPGSTVITFWTFWSEPSQQTALQQIVNAFEKQNPGVTVNITALSWNDGKAKLLAAFNSGAPPDALELGSDWVAQFSSTGALMDISPECIADTARCMSFALAPAFWGNRMYCIPWVVDTRAMFYNKGLMARAELDTVPPSTWDALNADCEKISALRGNVYGFGANASDAHRLYKKILPFFWANGGDILTSRGDSCVINSPQNIAAMEEYLRLTRCGMMETQKELDAQFARGAIGFWISGAWLMEKIRNENPALLYGVALMPQPSAQSGTRASFAGGEYLAVANASPQKDAALAFIRFLADGKNAITFCRAVAEAGYPADKNYITDSAFAMDPMRKVFTAQLQQSRMTPVIPQWLDIEKIIEDEIVEAMYGNKTAEEALNDAQKEIEDILKQ